MAIRHAGLFNLNDMAIRASKDELAVIWILGGLGWTSRRIARLKLPTSHHTVSDYFAEACELKEAGDLPITAMDERAIRLRYCGNSNAIENVDAVRNSGVCGGGRKIHSHIYDANFEDKSEE